MFHITVLMYTMYTEFLLLFDIGLCGTYPVGYGTYVFVSFIIQCDDFV